MRGDRPASAGARRGMREKLRVVIADDEQPARSLLLAMLRGFSAKSVRSAAAALEPSTPLRRIPVRKRNEIVLVSVEQIASVVADGELLHLSTMRGEKHTITYRLKDLEARLDPEQFVRLS